MPELFTKAKNQIKEFWGKLEKSQKTRIIIISSIIVLAVTIFIIIAAKPNYVALIHSSDTKEIGEMTKILDNAKISYELRDNGSGIYVKSGDNNKAQVTLLQSGYPKEGVSFEDSFKLASGVTITDADRKKLWDNWKNNTLRNKLKEDFSDILKDADVELALPEPTYFLNKDNQTSKATAYVHVTPKSELTSDQVKGIVQMISHSVENLDPKNVTVVDNNAIPLNTEADGVSSDTSSQAKLVKSKTVELEKKVYDLYSNGVDDFDTIKVSANPVLDFDKNKSLTQTVQKPDGFDGGALTTNKSTKETMDGGTTGGAAGTANNPGNGNTPSYPTGTNSNGNYSKTTTDQTFDYTRSTIEQEKALGAITDKTTMAVLLYYGRRVADASKLTDDYITQLKNDVSKATGVPAANISVNKYKLAPVQTVTESFTDKLSKFINSYGFFVLMLLLIIGLIVAAIPKKKKEEVLHEEITAGQLAAATGPKFIVPETMGEPVPEIEIEERSEVKKQIEKFVKQKPDAVAQLLRNWLSDDWE